jgi:hypothetical protein
MARLVARIAGFLREEAGDALFFLVGERCHGTGTCVKHHRQRPIRLRQDGPAPEGGSSRS